MKKEAIIVYEGINREYDNALLLKAALEKRGYKVFLAYKTETFLLRRHMAICILPNGYNSDDIDFYRFVLNANGNILVSLQYEQVLSKQIEESAIHIPKGKARDLWLFCWGENTKRRLIRNGIDPKKIKICGAIQLDSLLPEFADMYLSKSAISQKYGIDEKKKWVLYISSFSYVNHDRLLDDLHTQFNDNEFVDAFANISTRSQIITLEWFERIVSENKDVVIIYRPHPVEAENQNILRLVEKYPQNFYCISELGIKQWIKVSDVITTWFSTSAAEVYVAGKPLILVRPFDIPEEYDVPFYINADCVDCYEKLVSAICDNRGIGTVPISKEILMDYYSIQSIPAYERVAEQIDAIYAQEKIQRERGFAFKRLKFLFRNAFIFKLLAKKLYQLLFSTFGFQITNQKIRGKYYVNDWEHSIKNKRSKENQLKYAVIKKVVNS